MTPRVSLAELAAADIRLRPVEAVTILSEILRRVACGELHGVPTPGVIRITRDGALLVEGPTTTGDEVATAAHLLDDLLAGFEATPEYRASGALRLIVARAIGTLDLPPYSSLAEFCAALQRFGTEDLGETARSLFQAWERGRATRELLERESSALTISDIRRARRATGLSLAQIASVAEVPATQLRDLEWGYMRNWRADDSGRAEVIRYARAAGLDERLVLDIAWPMIEEAGIRQGTVVEMALVPSGPQYIVLPRRAAAAAPRSRYLRWALAAVGMILLALATAFALTQATGAVALPRVEAVRIGAEAVQVGETHVAAAPLTMIPAAAPDAAPSAPSVPSARPAVRHPRPAPPRRQNVPRRKPNLLQRELIRLVFR